MVPRGHRALRPGDARPPAQGERDGSRDRPLHRAAHRARVRVRGRRRRVLSCRPRSRVRAAFRPAARPGRGAGAEPAQGGSSRLRALEGEQAGRGHIVGVALGSRPSGLAHRVLGHGRGAPRPGIRDPRRRARPRLPPSRERARSVERARPRVRPDLDPQRHPPFHRREDVQVARQRRDHGRGARPAGTRDPSVDVPRRALAEADGLLRGDAPAGRRPGRRLPRGLPESRPSRPRKASGTGSWPRSTTISTRPMRSRSCTAGATTTWCAVRSSSSGSARLQSRRRRRRRWSTLARRRQQARADRDFGEADRLRGEIESEGWIVRDVEDGFRLVPK